MRESEKGNVKPTVALHGGELECSNGRTDARRISVPMVLACDEAYAMPLATTMRSMTEANRRSWPLDIHVLSDGFSKEMQRRVINSLPKGSASIRWVPVDLGHFLEFSTLEGISKMTYARFLIPQVFSENASRVMYLDADTLVLDDLGPIWETDLEGAVVGAVIDHGLDMKMKQGDPRVENVPRVRDYFNAGVLLIDLDRWRNEMISRRALEYLTQHPMSPFSDQDALNVVCDGRWKQLDPRWNFQDHIGRNLSHMPPEERPGVIHFVTNLKPWEASVISPNADYYDTFRSQTCFARTTWDKLKDLLQDGWARVKSGLRQYAIVRRIRKRMRPLKFFPS